MVTLLILILLALLLPGTVVGALFAAKLGSLWVIPWAVVASLVGMVLMMATGILWRLLLFLTFDISIPSSNDPGAAYAELIVYLPLSGWLGSITGSVLAGLLFRQRDQVRQRNQTLRHKIRYRLTRPALSILISMGLGGFCTVLLYAILYRFILYRFTDFAGGLGLTLYILCFGGLGGYLSAIAGVKLATHFDQQAHSHSA